MKIRTIQFVKSALLMITAVSFSILSQETDAQQAGGGAPPEFQQPGEAAIEDGNDVSSMVDNFLSRMGWTEGENTKSDGTPFYIAIGRGTIQAPRNHSKYINSRINAFEKALLAAKGQMTEYLGTAIEKQAESIYGEGFDNNPPPQGKKNLEEKARMLLEAKLDNELRKEGIEPEAATPAQIKKTLSKESFKSMSRTLARSRTIGLQVFKTFEASPSGAKGEVAVLCIWSKTLQEMAETIVLGGSMPTRTPKKPIVQQIPSNSLELLTAYGVQQKTDENGNLVLVAFAQAQPMTSSTRSKSAAESKAKTRAMGLIRQFAGEISAKTTDIMDAETTDEYEDGTSMYENESSFKEHISSYAKSMNISGISTIKRWSTKHPLNGKTVCGVVCTWSPQSSDSAKNLKKLMNSPQGNHSADENKYLRQGEGQEGSFRGAGPTGDVDSF